MNQHNLDTAMQDIKEKVRVYRVFNYNQPDPIYKFSTCKKNKNDVLDIIIERYAHENGLRIFENGEKVHERRPVHSQPDTFMALHRDNLGILEWKTNQVFRDVDHVLEHNKIEKDSVIASLKNSERGIKARFKFIKP